MLLYISSSAISTAVDTDSCASCYPLMTLETNLPVDPLPLYEVMRWQWNRMSPAVRQEISRQERH